MKPFARLAAARSALALIMLAGLAATAAAPAAAAKSPQARRDETMLHVALPTRIEQRCNARAMGEVSRGHADMRPDEAVAYAFADPKLSSTTFTAPGAAVRSRGHWYHISYKCQTTADGMDVTTFSYTLGGEVPRGDWSAHSLVP